MNKLTCKRCHYTWQPKGYVKHPKECPSCKSYKWDIPIVKPEAELKTA